ncbi:uncharacterized protein LOC119896412 isoform X1 [Micropterus salmoides]|uniref:uncharacterized protein LOC119896412 isoform X1 n=1 Tax=Micropterus salmoides TaxID=27706 RepID=UPI0018EBAE24|nr:uncharacterized protein LOC119896412 isoform X1 [Micropterus salmoides]
MWTTSFSPSLKMKESLTVPMSCTCGRCIMFTCHGLTGTWRFSGNNGTTVARALLASPYQIFVQGRLQRQTQPLTAMAEIFGSDTAQQGAAAAVPVLNWQERVTVPANRFGPSRAQTRQVQDVDTLAGPIGLYNSFLPVSLPTLDSLAYLPSQDCCVQCPVHRENFAVGEPFRQLPCNHFFHSEWIVPWLELRRCAVALDQQRTPRQPVRTTRTAWTTSSYFYRRDRRMLGEKRGGKLNYLVRSENESVSDR